MDVSIQKLMAEFTIEPLSADMETKFRDFLREYQFASSDENIFRWYRSLRGTTMFFSADRGKIIGTGMSISMGRSGWIGSICVHREFRGIGLGMALTQCTIDRLKSQGAVSILLRASEDGAKLYRKMGFMDTASYENFSVANGDIKPYERKNFRKIGQLSGRHFSMDMEFSGEERGSALSGLPVSNGYEIVNGEELEAFVYPSIGEGIVGISRDESYIPEIVSKIMSGRAGKIRTLKGTTLNRYMHELGFETKDGAKRMALGGDPVINKNGIIGTLSSSIG